MISGQLSPLRSNYVNACMVFRQEKSPRVRISARAEGEGPGKIFLVHGFYGDVSGADRRAYIAWEVKTAWRNQLIHRFPHIEDNPEYWDVHIAPEPVMCRNPALRLEVIDFLKGRLMRAKYLAEQRGDVYAMLGIRKKEARVLGHLTACKSCEWDQRTFGTREENISLAMTRILTPTIVSQSNQPPPVRLN